MHTNLSQLSFNQQVNNKNSQIHIPDDYEDTQNFQYQKVQPL
jgi:hypothetical protein